MIWQESYAIGIPSIDAQHKELFQRLEQLMDAASENFRFEAMVEMVEFLDRYTMEHFNDEEALMIKTAYPDLEEHRAMHEAFKVDLAIFKKELTNPTHNRPSITNLIGALCDWLIQHILDMDQRFGQFLKRIDQG